MEQNTLGKALKVKRSWIISDYIIQC